MKILSGASVGLLYTCMKVLQHQTKTMKFAMELPILVHVVRQQIE